MPKALDLTGKNFGDWLVLEKVDKKPGTHWKCLCQMCNKEYIVSGSNLNRGKSLKCKKCGQKEDLRGQQFGYLTVIKLDTEHESTGHAYWLCKCKCGIEKTISAKHLKDGSTISCGCYAKEKAKIMCENLLEDLTNMQFGKLTVIKRILTDDKKHTYWECLCSCGNYCLARQDHLKSQQKLSCGCQTGSIGEQIISELLLKNNILFEREKIFDDCINPKTGKHLRFDFYVNNQYLIEYDGEQHFKQIDFYNSTLEERQELDEIKNQWAKNHNIVLIRIPYSKLKSLTYKDIRA